MSTHETTSPDEPTWVEEWVGHATVVDSAEFVTYLATLTRTGLPLPAGLRALSSELPSRRLRHAMNETARRLELGTPLDAAVIEQAERFPPHLRGLIVAGSRSGRLADVLGQYVRYVSLGTSLRKRFRSVVLYPIILVAFLAGLYLFLCHAIVQSFEFILKDFGVEVPGITKTLFLLARITREHGAWLCTAVATVSVISLLTIRIVATPAQRRHAMTSIPLYGPMLRWSTLAEFCHMVGLLVDADTPLPEALALAGQGVNDAELSRIALEMRRAVEHGRTLSESLVLWPGCPAGLREVLDGSEGGGRLAESLHLAGDMFEARAQTQASFAATMVAVLTVMLVIWGIGFLFTAIYMPFSLLIWRLSG
jgi:type II secretory pathway component PulF